MSALGLRFIAEEVVGVFVADGEAHTEVSAHFILFEKTASHPPADEQAIAAVVERSVAPDYGPPRAAAGMKPQAAVWSQQAQQNCHEPHYSH